MCCGNVLPTAAIYRLIDVFGEVSGAIFIHFDNLEIYAR